MSEILFAHCFFIGKAGSNALGKRRQPAEPGARVIYSFQDEECGRESTPPAPPSFPSMHPQTNRNTAIKSPVKPSAQNSAAPCLMAAIRLLFLVQRRSRRLRPRSRCSANVAVTWHSHFVRSASPARPAMAAPSSASTPCGVPPRKRVRVGLRPLFSHSFLTACETRPCYGRVRETSPE